MALTPGVEFTIAHKQAGSDRLPWSTTYFLLTNTLPDLPYADAALIIAELCAAEAPLYYDVVQILGGTARAFTAKTTVPDPTPPPYDPSEHVAYSGILNGTRSPSGQVMFYDQVIDLIRAPEYGNVGHIEIRGALTETDVDQTLGSKVLSGAAAATWATLIDNFAIALAGIEDIHDVDFTMVTQPLLSTSYYIGDNGKPKATRTYGAAQFRSVVSWSVGPVRTDKGSNRYFDHGL